MSVALENVNRDNWKTLGEIKDQLKFGPEEMELSKFVLDLIDQDRDARANFDPNVVTQVIFPKVQKSNALLLGITALEELGIPLTEIVPPVDEALEYMKGRMDTHFLFLKPPYSPNELEELVSTYAHEKLGINNDDENPYRFEYFWDKARKEPGDVRPKSWEWVVITKGVVEETRNHSFSKQMKIIKKDDKKAHEPSLSDAVSAEFLYKVATDGGSLFPDGNTQNSTRWTYTWVTEKTNGLRFALGNSSRSGVRVSTNGRDCISGIIGVAAVRKFSQKGPSALGHLALGTREGSKGSCVIS